MGLCVDKKNNFFFDTTLKRATGMDMDTHITTRIYYVYQTNFTPRNLIQKFLLASVRQKCMYRNVSYIRIYTERKHNVFISAPTQI